VGPDDKPAVLETAQHFSQLGFKILATEGTHIFLEEQGIKTKMILKMQEGRPNIVDAIKNGDIHLVINTPSGKMSQFDDSYIRKEAIKNKIPYITTLTAAVSTARGIKAFREGKEEVCSLQQYHADI
jgi:carbamoyl-phosphate synthase large subunit